MGNKQSQEAELGGSMPAPGSWHPRYASATHLGPPHVMHQGRPRDDLDHSPSSADSQPKGSSRPGTSDSGYFTGLDSDGKRGKLRGSRVSLNDAVFPDTGSSHQYRRGPPPPFLLRPPPMPPPGMMGPPPPHFLGHHPPMFLPPELMNLDTERKTKKGWRKKGKKGKKSDGSSLRSGSLPPFRGMDGGGMGFRAQSMDNLHTQMLHPMGFMPPPQFPPHHPADMRRFSSQMDIRDGGVGFAPMGPMGPMPPHHFSPQTTPGLLKKEELRKKGKGTGRSDRTSTSGGGSRRSRDEATHFEEERLVEAEDPRGGQRTSLAPELLASRDPALYETLRGRFEPIVSAGDVEVHRSPSPGQEKPLKISVAARDLMERNEAAVRNAQPKLVHPQPKAAVQMEAEKAQSEDDSSEMSEDIRPQLQRLPPLKTAAAPKDFQPLNAWNRIPVDEALADRRQDWASASPAVEEGIKVRLGPVPPPVTVEDPLYGRLASPTPQHDPDSSFQEEWKATAKPGGRLRKDEIPTESGTTRVREWAREHLHSRNFALSKPPVDPSLPPPAEEDPPSTPTQRYESNVSIATSTAGTKESGAAHPPRAPTVADSEIDFSWVLDLENKFKKEREDQDTSVHLREKKSNGWEGYTPEHRRSFTQSFGSQGNLDSSGGGSRNSAAHQSNGRGPASPNYTVAPLSQPTARYFGMESSNYGVLGPPAAVSAAAQGDLVTNVRGKAAMFEQEAQRMNLRNEADRPPKHRSSSVPFRPEESRQRPASYHANAAARPPPPDYPTAAANARGPSERKIHQGRREGWISGAESPRGGRTHESTEFYRRNFQPQPQRQTQPPSRRHINDGAGYRNSYASQPSLAPLHHRHPVTAVTAEWH